jgi:ATP-binding cassette subfamily B protein
MFRRHVVVRQTDQNDCGAAALATVALHYGRPVALERLRDLTGTGRMGANLLGLQRAAQHLGFSTRAVRTPYEALLQMPLPAIAHVRDKVGANHFLVIHQARSKGVIVADPASGVERRSRDQFVEQWSGNLLLLVPDPSIRRVRMPAPTSPWLRLWRLLREHLGLAFEAVCCAILLMVLGLSSSFFVQHLVDFVLVRQETKMLHALGTGMLLIVVFRTLFAGLRQYLLAHIARKIDLTLLAAYMRHLLRLPVNFFETRRVGEIQSRAVDTVKIREAISGATTTTLVDGVLVFLVLVAVWMYDAPLALVSSVFVVLFLISGALHDRPAMRSSYETMEQWSLLAAHLIEDVTGASTIKAYGAEDSRTEQGEKHLVRFAQASFGLQKLSLSLQSVGLLLTGLASVVVLWYGGMRFIAGALSIGQLMFVSSLLAYLLEPLNRVTSVSLRLREALVAVDRLYQVLDLPTETELVPQKGPSMSQLAASRSVSIASPRKRAVLTRLQRGIEFRDVTFRYGHRGNVLEKVSLTIPAGRTVAIVGESGSGKSTLLNLLLQFHQPTEGRLLLDGVDLRDFDLASVRHRIGLVSQDSFVFNGSIFDNIALGRPGATLEEVSEAARAADLEEFIASLPERYSTLIGERGANLSGGQRQRLAIARALIRQPEILIFDEATSQLDAATESVIQDNLRSATTGRTVILVAHRLNTVRNADLIYVLRKGRIVEQGTHAQLMAQWGGTYAALYRSQLDTPDARGQEPLVPLICGQSGQSPLMGGRIYAP